MKTNWARQNSFLWNTQLSKKVFIYWFRNFIENFGGKFILSFIPFRKKLISQQYFFLHLLQRSFNHIVCSESPSYGYWFITSKCIHFIKLIQPPRWESNFPTNARKTRLTTSMQCSTLLHTFSFTPLHMNMHSNEFMFAKFEVVWECLIF